MGRPGGGNRDDLPTLRVTNISEDTQENDLRDLFGTFGRIARVYVGRDRETGAGKGFAFVSFEEKSHAQRAMEKMHGRGYDNLILSVQWSRKSSTSCLAVSTLLTVSCARTEGTAVNPRAVGYVPLLSCMSCQARCYLMILGISCSNVARFRVGSLCMILV